MSSDVMKKWNNGDSGQVVKEIIEENFNILFTRLNKSIFSKDFTASDWNDGLLIISQNEHKISNPTPHLFLLTVDGYSSVYGGSYIDSQKNVILQSDIPFDGKVVIK